MNNLNTDVTTVLDTITLVHKWNITGTEYLPYLKKGIMSPILSHENMDSMEYHIYIQRSSRCETTCSSSESSDGDYDYGPEEVDHDHFNISAGLLFYKDIKFATPLNIAYTLKDQKIKVRINSATTLKLCGKVEFSICEYEEPIRNVEILTCNISYVACLTKSFNLCVCYKGEKEPLVNRYKNNVVILKDNRELFKIEPKDCLRTIYEDPDFSDMTINVKEESFHIHSSILSYYPYFKDLILETKNRGEKHIHIQDIEPYVFKYILHYIYTGVNENLKSVIYQILPIVKKFGVHSLEEKCIRMLKDELTIDSLISTLNVATEINAKDLLSDIQTFVIKHISTISKRNEHKVLKQYYPDLLLQVLENIMT